MQFSKVVLAITSSTLIVLGQPITSDTSNNNFEARGLFTKSKAVTAPTPESIHKVYKFKQLFPFVALKITLLTNVII